MPNDRPSHFTFHPNTFGRKIFIICPVRNVEKETKEKIANYVADLESKGFNVYWPHRDNPYQQSDKIGLRICAYNRDKMLAATEVHIWYDQSSTGSIFDLGMFFAILHLQEPKKLVIANDMNVIPTPHKSFENVLLSLRQKLDPDFWNNWTEGMSK